MSPLVKLISLIFFITVPIQNQYDVKHRICDCLLTDSTDVVTGVSTISSYVATKSAARLSVHVQSFKYSPILESLSHS